MTEDEMHKIHELLNTQAICPSPGIQVYTINTTIQILQLIQRCKLYISGMDALIIDDNGKIQPDMAYDFDFNTITIEEVFKILRNLDKHYHFEIFADSISSVPIHEIDISITDAVSTFMRSKTAFQK